MRPPKGAKQNSRREGGAINNSSTVPTTEITSSGRDIPLMGMLLDRTSFDEADDLGVDREKIKSRLAERGDETNFQAAPPMLMKNGKVRRRLRWRARSPRKQQSVERLQHVVEKQRGRLHYRTNRTSPSNNNNSSSPKTSTATNTTNTKSTPTTQEGSSPAGNTTPTNATAAAAAAAAAANSSGCSVVSASNYSHVSRQSKVSVHSFASIETAAMSNKKKDRFKRFSIMKRPNYPKSLDSTIDATNNQTTIGTEGEIVQSKLNSSTTNSDGNNLTTKSNIDQSDETGSCNSSDEEADDSFGALLPAIYSTNSIHNEKKGGLLPPLGRKNSRSLGSSSFSVQRGSRGGGGGGGGDEMSVVSGLSMGSSSYISSRSQLASVKSDLSASVHDSTMRFGDEMEDLDRRVDLRIVPSHCSTRSESYGFPSFKRSSLSTHDAQMIHELRSNSFPTNSSQNKMSRSVSSLPFQVADEQRQGIGDTDSIGESSERRCDDSCRNDDYRQRNSEDEEDSRHYSGRSFASETIFSTLFAPITLKTVVSESFLVGSSKKDPMNRRKSLTHNNNNDKTNNDLNQESSDIWSHPPTELRFSMSRNSSNLKITVSEGGLHHSNEPIVSPPTCILDVAGECSSTASIDEEKMSNIIRKSVETATKKREDGAFLEAEKNLQAIQEVATEHLQQGEYSEALEVFQEILRGLLTRYGEEHARVGTAVHNIGVVHMRRGDYEKAVVAYKEAVRVRKMVLDTDHPDVAVSLAQLGMAYLELNKHQRAIGAFREALRIRRKCFGNYHPKVGKVLNNIGCALYELDELEVARVAFEEALDIQRRILRNESEAAESKGNDAALLSIASTQSNIASIKLYYGEFEEAILDLEEVLLMQESVLGDDHILVKRTRESLEWLEIQRGLQQEFKLKLGDNIVGSELYDPNVQLKDMRSFFRKNGSQSTITELAETDKATIANGVFRTIERSFRKFHADLDYMSCGAP